MNTKNENAKGAMAATIVTTNITTQTKSLSDFKIYYRKSDLLANKSKNNTIIIALDANQKGAKGYIWLDSHTQMIQFLEQTKTQEAHFYEIFQNTNDYPCYIFMDVDRDLYDDSDNDIQVNLSAYFNEFMTAFINTFQRFLSTIYNHHIHLKLGENMQVCYSLQPSKLSAHIVIKIPLQNINALKQVISTFDAYLSSTTYESNQTRSYFYFYKQTKGHREYTPVIDQAVYSNFRAMRIIYSTKLATKQGKKPLPLLPYNESSPYIKDHLCMVYNNNANITQLVPITNIATTLSHPSHSIRQTSQAFQTHSHDSLHGKIPHTVLESVEELLKTDKDILTHFNRLSFNYNQYITPTIYTFAIDKRCRSKCPYAQRIHSNNRSYFEYNYVTNMIKYKCFNERCKKIQEQDQCIVFKLTSSYDALQRFADLTTQHSLHCKQDVIQWNESYSEPQMRPYPLKPIVCVKANMGVGKTKELDNFINKYVTKHDKCLFITYQRVLSNKYHDTLKHYDFVNYQNCCKQTPIKDIKVIVCLDSLKRVDTDNFDFIFIDEVLSVLLHFNSSQMKSAGFICSQFELLCLQAKHVYLLDACVDNQMVYNFVENITLKRGHTPYWIRNTYVRPSNRHVHITVNNLKSKENCMRTKAIMRVTDLLNQNKKVVISASTKSFTEKLANEIKTSCPIANIMVYNSNIAFDIIKKHAQDLHATWSQYDAIIYSPTISSGMSFELPYFDNLVAYLDNIPNRTPTIDLSIQQLYRVRNLSTGSMELFVNDIFDLSADDYPIQDQALERYLERNIKNLDVYFPEGCSLDPTIVKDRTLQYDKDKLSYTILKGIVYNHNKSWLMYTDILRHMLQTDYNIPVTTTIFVENKGILQKALDLQKEWQRIKQTQEIKFSSQVIINEDAYYDLKKKVEEEGHQALTPLEKQQQWTYEAIHELWRVDPKLVDERFYKTFVGQATDRKTYYLFWKAKRVNKMFNNEYDVTKQNLLEKIEFMLKDNEDDYNIELYRNNFIKSYQMLIEGQILLDDICDGMQDYKTTLKDVGTLELKGKQFTKNCKEYFDRLTEEWYKDIVDLFNLKEHYHSLEEMRKSTKKQTWFVKHVLDEVFGVNIITDSQNRTKTYTFDGMLWVNLHGYRPFVFQTLEDTYCFLDNDQPDCIDK